MPGPAITTIEPIVGWRAWDLTDEAPDGPLLYAVGASEEAWRPGRAMEARCALPHVLRRGRASHRAPDPGCVCGIYATRSPSSFVRRRPAWPPPTVVGTVSLWGRVIEHESGWRAASAYPARLALACVVCAWVEPGPGAPTSVHRFGRYLYALCGSHPGGIEVPDGRRSRPTGVAPADLQQRLLNAYGVDLLPLELVRPLFQMPRTPDPPGYWPTIRVVPGSGGPPRG